MSRIPTASELEKLPSVVKVHIKGTRVMHTHQIENEAYIKRMVEDVSGADVIEAIFPLDDDDEHIGYSFVRVRKEHVAQIIATCDGIVSNAMTDYEKRGGDCVLGFKLSLEYDNILGINRIVRGSRKSALQLLA